MNRSASIQPRSPSNAAVRRRRTGGFTLIEVTLAAVIVSLVMAGLFSAMMLASRVAETPFKRSALDLHGVMDRIRQDAAITTGITQMGGTSVKLVLPDRDGDGSPDTVIYDWGQATATNGYILRTENGVAESIPVRTTTFTVSGNFDTSTTSDVSESSEQLLFTRAPLVPLAYSIKSNQWTGQYVIPALPSSAVTWRVTRVRFPARCKGPAVGSTRVQIRTQSGGLPTTVIDEAVMPESTLPVAYATQEFTFTRAKKLPVTSGVCVVFQWVSDADAAEVQYEALASALAAGNRVTSTNSGASWTAASLQAVAMDVYGTYTLPAGVTTTKLRSVTVQIKSDSAMAAPITTTIRFNNLPTVSG